MTLSKSGLEKSDNINKYISLLGQLMWSTNKVLPDVANAARELVVHMSHPGPEHWKVLVRLIGYLKGGKFKEINSFQLLIASYTKSSFELLN